MAPIGVLMALSIVAPGAGCTVLPGDSSQNDGSAVTLSLVPDSTTFDVERVRRGAVGFTARIRNEGATAIRIAHPAICFPADFEEGDTRRRQDSHGLSEILLTIERPDGERVVLREGLFGFFDPGNVDHLDIPPGGTGSFHVGWFFQNARGRWEDDARAWSIFLDEGEYGVRILFRNRFPRAWIRDGVTERPRTVEVWTGEMESEAVTVVVESSDP
jgi:hypothetical protein